MEEKSKINEKLYENALNAIMQIFSDRTMPGESNIQSLERLVLEINELIQILQNEETIS